MSTLARRAIVLGLLIAVGPFAIDMYLPGFAAIAREFGTDDGAVQLSLVSFFAAMAVGQIVWGPISDALGRKRPAYAGIALFMLASIGCAFAPSIETLVALRFVQGLGGSAGMVIAIAVIRDLHTGAEAARLLALAILALSVSPILAPILGGLIVQFGSWQLIFWSLALIGLLVGCLVWRGLPETHPPERRTPARIGVIARSYRQLLGSPWFMTAALTSGTAQAGLLAYIAGSPSVFISLHGVTPLVYSLIFATNAAALIGGAQLVPWLIRRLGIRRMVTCAVAAYLTAGLVLAGAILLGYGTLEVTVVLVFLTLGCLGLIMPSAGMLALEPFGRMAGTAAALSGGLQATISTLATLVVSSAYDGTARPMVLVMAGAALVSAASWSLFLLLADGRGRTCASKG